MPYVLKDYFEFLDELRTSGHTNMLGAAPYIRARFGVSIRKAKEILLLWINMFEDREKSGLISKKKMKVTERTVVEFTYEDEDD